MKPFHLLAPLIALACGDTAGVSIAPCEPNMAQVAYDDFERPDQLGLGAAPTGQPWAISGAGYLEARIEQGRFTERPNADANVVYAAIFDGDPPARIGGKFSLVPGAGSQAAGIALISSSDTVLSLEHMLHLIVGDYGWRLTTWNASEQDRELAEHTTQSEFPTPLRHDGTVYEVWMTVHGDSVHLDLPEGMTADYRDPIVPTLAGKQTIWELPYNSTSAALPRWESVATFARLPGCSSR